VTSAHEISLAIPATPQAAGTARHAVDGLPLDDHLEASFNLRLLISELVGNSVRHGDLSPQDTITLDVDLDDDRVRAVVSGHGHGSAEPVFGDDPPAGVSGRGVFLVDALADHWGTGTASGGRSTVWFEIHL
jgi:anti-sigma regulatory factor (Ser/Thr protein kinase)